MRTKEVRQVQVFPHTLLKGCQRPEFGQKVWPWAFLFTQDDNLLDLQQVTAGSQGEGWPLCRSCEGLKGPGPCLRFIFYVLKLFLLNILSFVEICDLSLSVPRERGKGLSPNRRGIMVISWQRASQRPEVTSNGQDPFLDHANIPREISKKLIEEKHPWKTRIPAVTMEGILNHFGLLFKERTILQGRELGETWVHIETCC